MCIPTSVTTPTYRGLEALFVPWPLRGRHGPWVVYDGCVVDKSEACIRYAVLHLPFGAESETLTSILEVRVLPTSASAEEGTMRQCRPFLAEVSGRLISTYIYSPALLQRTPHTEHRPSTEQLYTVYRIPNRTAKMIVSCWCDRRFATASLRTSDVCPWIGLSCEVVNRIIFRYWSRARR